MPPTVAIVGRPNVGKSTLFNRLVRTRRAITHDIAGMTRDRVIADASRPAGGAVVLVDTGGFEPEAEAAIPAMVREQAMTAVEEVDAVVLLVDGSEGLLPAEAVNDDGVFLDDVSFDELAAAARVPLRLSYDFADVLAGETGEAAGAGGTTGHGPRGPLPPSRLPTLPRSP